MLRFSVNIFLLILFVCEAITPIIPFIEYEIQKSNIAVNYCISQNSSCLGKCYLRKQLKKAIPDNKNKSSKSTVLKDLKITCPLSEASVKQTTNYVGEIFFFYKKKRIKVLAIEPPTQPPKLFI